MWTPPLSVLIGLLALEIGYLLAVGPWRRRFPGSTPVGRGRQATFLLGVLALGTAWASPLDALSGYLLSAHMLQHLLLTMVTPPLLLLGTPAWLLRPALRWPGVAPVARLVTRARWAFAIGNGLFVAWHFPALYDLAVRNDPIHIVQHLSFLTTAALIWWPLTSPLPEFPPLLPPLQMLYVFLQVLPGMLLGIIITHAPVVLYRSYLDVPRLWGLDAKTDQLIAGLLMWIGGSSIWLGVLTTVFFGWVAREEAGEATEGPPAGRRA